MNELISDVGPALGVVALIVLSAYGFYSIVSDTPNYSKLTTQQCCVTDDCMNRFPQQCIAYFLREKLK